ncbi:hypothetical protein HYC85_031270 [Camellia sinensis]|uniref:SHSP domain-containing protein n=1 Tax=Camellia sinensis TaxID=4442 RepID=A0A7J7FQV7_CAMSI|nr:hypothetical protein HYC85_031270 [Camellia sinensis]
MKVHPAPKKRNITIRYNIASTFSQANALACRQKKLRRLPHIFAKVLELPFHSDADVLIDETSDCFRFVVNTDDIGDDIRAQTIEIYPGVTKIVIRGTNVLDLSMDELDLDMWRFRLPASTRPELASAAYNDGQLVVMVPKDANFNGLDVVDREEEVWGEGNGDIGAGRLVLVHHGLEVMKEREVWGLEFVILSRHARRGKVGGGVGSGSFGVGGGKRDVSVFGVKVAERVGVGVESKVRLKFLMRDEAAEFGNGCGE